jgi:hypothetical protein
MNMNTEVIRDRGSLAIRWNNEAGDRWTVTKKFDPSTRHLLNATINCSADGSWDETERQQAHELAYELDVAFRCPEDFDRVKISDNPAAGGGPAQIDGIVIGGPIYIAIAPKDGAKKRTTHTPGPWEGEGWPFAPKDGAEKNRLLEAAPEILEMLKLAQHAIEACWLNGIVGRNDLCTTLQEVDKAKFSEARTGLREMIAKLEVEA